VARLNDPKAVRSEYQDESRFAVRAAAWANATGPSPRELAFEAIAEAKPVRVLEVGCGRGELAERVATELGADVVAVDQSERMVELTCARGLDARLGDVQELSFEDGVFDCAIAAWMLYHVPDLDQGLAELARVLRPEGRLVAVTNSETNLAELWRFAAGEAPPVHTFSVETAHAQLERHFGHVEERQANGTVTFPDWDAAHQYVENSVTRRHLADRLPRFEGPLVCSRLVSVFVAEGAR
jgi:2-polyprenyl-3-methyl-5-hydroxy-6-metoxy-1,4-benzoquinol methylase